MIALDRRQRRSWWDVCGFRPEEPSGPNAHYKFAMSNYKFAMSETLAQALSRAARVALTGGCLALAYCVAFTLVTGKSAGELLPSLALGYAVLAALMVAYGVNCEQDNDLSGAANFYTRALGYHLVATVVLMLLSA
jgi:hypothetical protein